MIIKVAIEGQTYTVELKDLHTTPVLAEVDGKVFEVFPETQVSVDPAVVQPPAPVAAPVRVASPAPVRVSPPVFAGAGSITAPLPGTITAVLVKAGDAVTRGQEVITLEAMKMKNAIRAASDGVVADVHVSQGDLVKHGQILVSFKA